MMNDIQHKAIQSSIETFKQTKFMMQYAWQLEGSIKNNSIKPENLTKVVFVDENEAEFTVEFDWTKHPKEFQGYASQARISIISFWIIQCREIYHALFNKGKEIDSNKLLYEEPSSTNIDLYAAQCILPHTRHAFGHFKICLDDNLNNDTAIPKWSFDKSGVKKLEIKRLNITLDTAALGDKQLEWSDIGGIKNFIKILDILRENLEEKLK